MVLPGSQPIFKIQACNWRRALNASALWTHLTILFCIAYDSLPKLIFPLDAAKSAIRIGRRAADGKRVAPACSSTPRRSPLKGS